MTKSSVRLRGLVLGGLFLALAAAFVYVQLRLPSDGTRLEPAQPVWRPNGVVVTPLEGATTPLLPGDVVIAVDGRSLEAWAQAIFQPGFPKQAETAGRALAYTVLREGRQIDLAIAPLPYPLLAILARSWSTLLFTFCTQLVMTFVFLLRPNDRSARALFLWAFSLSNTYVWALGLQVADLVNGLGFWLYQLSASGAWLIFWSAGLEFAMVFPRIHPLLQRRPELVRLTYLSSFLIFFLYLLLIRILSPTMLEWLGSWIVGNWFVAAIFQALSVYFVVDGYRSTRDPVARKKVRWLIFAFLLCGGLGLSLWFLPGLVLGRPLIDANALGLLLLPFPFILALAVLRHQLFDIDIILRRTLVYVPLTATLAGIFAATITLSQRLSAALTGGSSDAATVLTTLVVVAAFDPLKTNLQHLVDRRFKETRDPARQLDAFSAQVQNELGIISPPRIARRLLKEAVSVFEAQGGAAYLGKANDARLLTSIGEWHGSAQLTVPLQYDGQTMGRIELAARKHGVDYSAQDRKALQKCTLVVARALAEQADEESV